MAPGRKRGASKAKAKNQLSLGDLVLAKVKGFPAWPAKEGCGAVTAGVKLDVAYWVREALPPMS